MKTRGQELSEQASIDPTILDGLSEDDFIIYLAAIGLDAERIDRDVRRIVEAAKPRPRA